MLENTYYIIIIVSAIISTAIGTVTILFSLQKSFRDHIDEVFELYDKSLKIWLKATMKEYYITLDEKIRVNNLRIKELEKK